MLNVCSLTQVLHTKVMYMILAFLARLHFSAEELLLYPRRRRQRRRPQTVRANVKVLEF